MYTNCGIIELTADRVLRSVMLPLIVESTEAEVPPKVMVLGFAVPDATPPPILIKPLPMQVEFAPAAPIVRNTKSNARYQAAAVCVTVPCVKETPRVVPAGPH